MRACCIMPALLHLILTHITLLCALAQLPLHTSSLSASFYTSSLAHLLSYVSPHTSALTLLTFTRLALPNLTLKRKPHTPCPHTPRLRAHLALTRLTLTRAPSHTSASHALPVQASLFFRVSSKTGLPMPPPRDEASRYQPDVTSCAVLHPSTSPHLSPPLGTPLCRLCRTLLPVSPRFSILFLPSPLPYVRHACHSSTSPHCPPCWSLLALSPFFSMFSNPQPLLLV